MAPEGQAAAQRPLHLSADRIFYGGMGILLFAAVFAGFAPTYYLKTPDAPDLTPFLQVHGAVLTAWYLLYIGQTALISARQTPLHRRVGVFGLFLAASVAILSMWETIASRGFNDRIVFSAVAVAMFIGFIAAGWRTRRNPEAHKRFMLLSMITLMAPAVARYPVHILPHNGLNSNIEALVFLLPMFVFDLAIRRKLHPVTLWGGLFMIAMVPFRVFLKGYVF